MVIHSSPGTRKKRPVQKKQENKPIASKEEVVLEQLKVEEENILLDDILAADIESEITSLPKKRYIKKVTKDEE